MAGARAAPAGSRGRDPSQQPNRDAAALDTAHGLAPVFQMARMYSGPIRDVAVERVYGVTMFE